MALKVGELFATLKLDDAGFTKELSTAKGKAEVLNKAIASSTQQIDKYKSALSDAKSALAAATSAQTENKASLKAATTAHEELEQRVSDLQAKLKEAASATDEFGTAAREDLTDSLKQAKAELKESASHLKKLEAACQQSDAKVEKLSATVKRNQKSLKSAESNIRGYQSELKALDPILTSNIAKLEDYSLSLKKSADAARKASEWQNKAGNVLTLGVTTPILGGMTYAAKEAINFEDAFAGVEKTVNASEEQLASLRQAYIDLSEEIPVAKEELAGIGEVAGQLGIKYEALEGFTKVIADLGATTNIETEEGAASLARFANITGLEQTNQNFESLASAIVDLGNNSATSEAEILAMAMRLAGAGRSAGMSEADILGVSTALSSLGVEAEMGGSAFSRLISMIQVSVETGSDSLVGFAEIAGMSAEQFAQAFRDKPAEALSSFIVGLGSGTESATVLLDELGITELRLSDALRRTSNANGLFVESIQRANTAWKENTAMTKEAEKRYGTFASRLSRTKNKINNVAMTLGESLMPTLEGALENINGLVDGFANLDEGARQTILSMGAIAAGVGPTLKILGKANDLFANLSNGLSTLVQTSAAAGGGFKGLGKGILSLAKSALGPGGLALGGIALVGYGIYKLSNKESASEELQKEFDEATENTTLSKDIIVNITATPEFTLSEDTASKITGVYDDIATKLTDGEPDSTEVVNGLKENVSTLFSDTRTKIEEWYTDEMSKLDLDTEQGIQDAMRLAQQRDSLIEETEQAESETYQFIGTYAGASTSLVKQHVGELDTLAARISQINLELETQKQLAESVQKASFDLVVAGQASDDQSIGEALNYAFTSWKIDANKLQAYSDTQIAEAKKAFAAGGETLANFLKDSGFAEQLDTGASYDDWHTLFTQNQQEQVNAAQQAYKDNIQAVFSGILMSMGEEGVQLEKDFEKLGIIDTASQELEALMSTLDDTYLAEMTPAQKADFTNRINAWMQEYGGLVSAGLTDSNSLESLLKNNQSVNLLDFFDIILGDLGGSEEEISKHLSGLFSEDTQIGKTIVGATESKMLEGLGTDGSSLIDSLATIYTPESFYPIGDNVGAGIGTKVADHDYSSDAETSISNLETALGDAAQQGSPAKRFYPLGEDISAGVAEGMKQFSFNTISSEIVSSIRASMSGMTSSFRTTGLNFSLGLASGIRLGKFSVINAAKGVAKAGVNAANNKLKVSSPSRVMEETGRFFDLGFAQGIERNDGAIAKSAANIARMAAEMTAISNPGRGAYARNNPSVTVRQQPLDYDQLAEAMARIQLNMNYRGRTFAQISAEDTARAQNRRAQGIALGYGKR